jgi:hypothetical protein
MDGAALPSNVRAVFLNREGRLVLVIEEDDRPPLFIPLDNPPETP